MAEQVLDETVATLTKVSAEEYFEKYAEQYYEWVDGALVKMWASGEHNELMLYLAVLFKEYLVHDPIGQVRVAPFLMDLEAINRKREPDLQIILNTNPGQLTPTRMIGPADICIEIVSPDSVQRDYAEKLVNTKKPG
jgi:Uma2 family endonuclease